MAVVCFFFGQKYFPIPYQTGKDLFYLLLAFSLSYVGFFLELDQPFLQFITRNSLVIVFVLVVLWLEKDELQKFSHPLKKRKS
jgi:hypothetical protein